MGGVGLKIGSGFTDIIKDTTTYMTQTKAVIDAAKPSLIMATAEGMGGVIGGLETGFGFLVDKTKIGMSNIISSVVDSLNSFSGNQNKVSSSVVWPTDSTSPQFKGAGMGGHQTIVLTAVNINLNPKTGLTSSEKDDIGRYITDIYERKQRSGG
jgi:hypothetical protein